MPAKFNVIRTLYKTKKYNNKRQRAPGVNTANNYAKYMLVNECLVKCKTPTESKLLSSQKIVIIILVYMLAIGQYMAGMFY